MWERSSFTFIDLLKQRKRWMQGIFLVVHEQRLPWKVRFFTGICSHIQVFLYITVYYLIIF
jgi:egghead protein (zeste-white 4 protein)